MKFSLVAASTNAVLALFIARRAIFENATVPKFDLLSTALLSARSLYLLSVRKPLFAILFFLNFVRFKLNSVQRPLSFFQHFLQLVKFGKVGYNLPPNGNAHFSYNGIKNGLWKRHRSELNVTRKLGPIWGVYILGRYAVWISDPELVEEVMLDKVTYPSRGPTGFSELTKLGLLGLPTGEMHTKHRRIISAFMSNTWLKNYSNTIERETELLISKWVQKAEVNDSANIAYDLSMVTLEVIMQACTGNSGSDLSSQLIKEEDNELAHGLDFALKEIIIKTAVPILNYFPSPSKNFFETKFKAMWKVAREKAEVTEKQPNAPLMIYTALKSTGELSEDEIHDELMTIRGAGHETTSNTLAWALYLLALEENKDKLVKLRNEVETLFANKTDNSNCVTYEESKNLPYTQSVVYEALRLFPTVPSFPREAAYDTKLGGYDIPKNTLVFVSLNSMNKSEKLWTEPDKFIPERFENVEELQMGRPVGIPNGNKFGFLPFGAGPRTCVGQRLAMLEAIEILAAVTHKFEWSLDWSKMNIKTGVVEVAEVTLGPKEGLYMNFKLRNK